MMCSIDHLYTSTHPSTRAPSRVGRCWRRRRQPQRPLDQPAPVLIPALDQHAIEGYSSLRRSVNSSSRARRNETSWLN